MQVLPFLQAIDTANAEIGAERNEQKHRIHLLRLRPGRYSIWLEDQ